MSREIKFNYILQHQKTGMLNSVTFGYAEIFNGLCKSMLTDGLYKDYIVVAKRQFTGLKDKNGREIYEGDIVAIFNLYSDNSYDEETNSYYQTRPIREIKWNKAGGFTLEFDYGDYELTLVGWAMEDHELELEIIGNLFETPELLVKGEEKQ